MGCLNGMMGKGTFQSWGSGFPPDASVPHHVGREVFVLQRLPGVIRDCINDVQLLQYTRSWLLVVTSDGLQPNTDGLQLVTPKTGH